MYKKILAIFSVCFISSFICLSLAHYNIYSSDASDMIQELIENFIEKYGEGVKIKLDENSGFPIRISGFKAGEFEGKPEEMALVFLSENSALLGIDINNIVFYSSTEALGCKDVKFSQLYKGLPVHKTMVNVHISKDGMISGVKSKYIHSLDLDIVPTIRAEEAAAVIMKDLGIDELVTVNRRIVEVENKKAFGEPTAIVKENLLPVEPELVILPVDRRNVHLCWTVILSLEDPPVGSHSYYIDAHTGEITSHNLLTYSYIMSGYTRGNIWPKDGSQNTSEQGIRDSRVEIWYWDYTYYVWKFSTAQTTNYFYYYYQSFNNGQTWYGALAGPLGYRAAVASDYYGYVPAWYSPAYYYSNFPVSYTFTFSSAGSPDYLDCVNVFYHLNKALYDYYDDELGYTFGDQVHALVHWYEDDVSEYDSGTDELHFGAGGSMIRNSARSRDAILHELQHRVTAYRTNTFSWSISDVDLNAISEAYSDYFACTQQGDPNFGEWVFQDSNNIRWLAVDKIYPDDWDPNVYADANITVSMIYKNMLVPASTFWDIRDEFGQDDADEIIFGAMAEKPDTLADLRDECYAYADETMEFDPNQLATLDQIFVSHGIP